MDGSGGSKLSVEGDMSEEVRTEIEGKTAEEIYQGRSGVVAYASAIIWRPRRSEKRIVVARYYPSREEADAVVEQEALRQGWTAPRWWQYWRWAEPVREIMPVESKPNAA